MSEDELKFDLEYFKHKSLADKSSNRQGVAVIVRENFIYTHHNFIYTHHNQKSHNTILDTGE